MLGGAVVLVTFVVTEETGVVADVVDSTKSISTVTSILSKQI